ncbi:putative uncharacterized protein [Acetobacter sp. CAG:977]|nr:putative uncharacterized protein [Acetobacter sp. CAG:977]
MSLSLAMNSALNGIKTSQNAIDLTSSNISNVNTEGYTRKVYKQSTLVLYDGRSSGAISALSTRQIDENMLKSLRTEAGILQYSTVKSYYLGNLQDLMGSPSSSSSLSHNFSSMQTAFESLGVDTDKLNAQGSTVNSLQTALSKIQKLNSEIQASRLEVDKQIEALAKEATEILAELDKLNDDIVRTEALAVTSSDDYKDQRDLLITRLSEIMDIQTYERSSGETVIMTKSGKPLLDKDPVVVSHTSVSQTGSLTTYSGGQINGLFAGSFDITKEVKSGELAGLIEMRDKTLPEKQNELDELAYHLTKELNQVHNKGTNYPNMGYAMTGTRTFIDTSSAGPDDPLQQITISGGDVKIVLFDADGKEAFSASLTGDLDFTSGAIHNAADHPAETGSLTSTIQAWLRTGATGPHLENATVTVNDEGKLSIDLGSSEYSISFRDETSYLDGAEQKDVTIGFDADGDGTVDKSYQGFSNFFGLNDLIIKTSEDTVYDSKIIDYGVHPPLKGTTTLHFSDKTNGIDFGSIDINIGDDLRSIADKINADENLQGKIEAQYVQEGSGYRLRIINCNNEQMEITETGAGGLTEFLGLDVSRAGYAADLKVRDDIVKTPGKLNTGTVQYSQETQSYFVSNTDNSIANEMTAVFTKTITFDAAGGFSGTTGCLADYASSIVSGLATDLSSVNSKVSYQSDLVETLYSKQQEVSGVNLDEELANLLMYERSYSAAAKAMSTAVALLEILDNMI